MLRRHSDMLIWKGRLVSHTWNAWDCLMATVWSDLPMILNAKWVPEIKRLQMLLLVENAPCYLQSFWINLNSKFHNRESKYHISKYYNGNSKSRIILNRMDVSENSGTPKSSHFNRVFHYKPSILGFPYFWKHPYLSSIWKTHTLAIPFEIFPSSATDSPLEPVSNRPADCRSLGL